MVLTQITRVERIVTVACTIPRVELVWTPVPMAYCLPVRSTDGDARCTLYMNSNALSVDDCRPQATVLLLQRPADILEFGMLSTSAQGSRKR